ncbi:MAG: hypothetical protein MUF23_12990 [Pirellula sp.]|nr:hypothetical protein [Pirellula sp.]
MSEPALLERARLALQSLQFEEEAARYRAACSELMEAIADAEAGNEEPLKRWLDARRTRIDPGTSNVTDPNLPVVASSQDLHDHRAPIESASLEPAPLEASSPSPSEPWQLMLESARERAKDWFADAGDESTNELDSLHVAVRASADRVPTDLGKRQRVPLHLVVSLLVHVLLLLGLGWWVVAAAQKNPALSITAGPTDSEEVLFETSTEPLHVDTPMAELSEEPAPLAEMDHLPIDTPKIAAMETSFAGPTSAEATLAGSTLGAMHALGTGARFTEGAEFFGSKAAGNSFIFVVDCSPSMAKDGAFDHAKTEILKSLGALQPKQRFHVFFFAKEILPIQFPGKDPERYMLQADAENLQRAVQWIGRAAIQKDGRAPIEALREAIAMQPDGIFVLFDGDTKVDNWTTKIRELNRSDDFLSMGEIKVPIHVVHFFREEFAPEMKRLADENDGTYRFVPRPQKGGPR